MKPAMWGGQGPYKDCRATDDDDDDEIKNYHSIVTEKFKVVLKNYQTTNQLTHISTHNVGSTLYLLTSLYTKSRNTESTLFCQQSDSDN
jgi:hypothetical protein